MGTKEKFPLYLSPEKKAALERRYQEEGSRSITGFIENAIDFYLDYLSANNSGLFLPSAVQSYLDGRLDQMENRMASLLFKQAVELDMGLGMLFKCVNVSEEELRRQRAESVANVKKANGKVSLVQKLRELEENWSQVQSSEGYARYIATRPRAERLGDHGLFGDEDSVELDKAMSELGHYTGNVWTHIISLHREDAVRLGYDNAQAWRSLLRTHRNDIAAAMNIKPQDFRWYAAFHDEGEHPHVHMMAWSVKPGEAYLSRDGIRNIKSALTNQIFKQEMLHLYEQKSESRDELVRETRKVMLELSRQMSESVCEQPEVERMILNLVQSLEDVKGKKSYGYLPKSLKRKVDEIVTQMEYLPVVDRCYQKWWELQCKVNDFYSERARQRPPLSEQKEFRAIKMR